MSWKRVGRFVVTVHSAQEPFDDEWNRYVLGAHEFQPLEAQRILVVSGGGAPNAAQRRQLVEALAGAQTPTAILTTSWIMRGAATAFRWFNPSLRVLGPSALAQAMDHLQLTGTERTTALRLIQELQRELGVRVVSLPSLGSELTG